MSYSSEEKMKILYEESLTDIRDLMSEVRIVKANLSEISENITATINNFANKNLQLTSVEIYTSVRKAVELEFSGHKLALKYGATGVEAFNLAISKIDVNLSARTLEGCRLIILGGMSVEDASQQVDVMTIQLRRAVKEIKKMIPPEHLNGENQIFKPVFRNSRFKNKPETVIEYAQYFGFFLLGLILMYFLKY